MDHASWLLYEQHIQDVKTREYPMLDGTTYLDHAGTTPIPKSLMERFSKDMISNLYGNPHSASASSQLSTRRIEDIRLVALQFFNADPAHYDLVFVANATAGIKLVMECFRDNHNGFWYGYHGDSHTSLVGVREAATRGSRCFTSDVEVAEWLDAEIVQEEDHLELFAYPGQSNMNGRRLPRTWPRRMRNANQAGRGSRYTLYDAAALVSTSPLDLSDAESAPDFTVLSFYKIFGFPDLGALIVRKKSADVLSKRRYFGGGTVDMVVSLKEQWHAKKLSSIHASLEDGTLPIHNILALGHAFDVHKDLFGGMEQVSQHTRMLAKLMHDGLQSLRHGKGASLCTIYNVDEFHNDDSKTQGPIVAFNLCNAKGLWISNTEVEKLASIRGIQLRTGGLCNPGGIASSLQLQPWEMRDNFSAGQRCDGENDLFNNKPTGTIRVSFGAMSTLSDVNVFLDFLREFFVESHVYVDQEQDKVIQDASCGDYYVESLAIYPIKSCGAWSISPGLSWEVRKEGLLWDREWCLVHQGTGAALSQKRYPRMAMIRPIIDLKSGKLVVKSPLPRLTLEDISVPLSADPRVFQDSQSSSWHDQESTVCGENIQAKIYTSQQISNFFSTIIGVPCHLARFPASSASSLRHFKPHLQSSNSQSQLCSIPQPILLSNYSPILIVSRSSLNRLNEQIKQRRGKAAQAEVFRPNIVVGEDPKSLPGSEYPYAEDYWRQLDIGGHAYNVLGGCRRCQMVCIDQQTGEKNEEPFVTLAKTRRSEGKVWFGVHTCVAHDQGLVRVTVGNVVKVIQQRP